jgi:flagellin
MKSAIENTAGLEHVSVTDNGDGSITITQGLVPTIEGTEVELKNAAESTLAYDDTNKLTVGGSFVDGKNYSFSLMGKDISVTASSTDGFSNDKAGVASQIAQAINDASIHGISASKTANENAVTIVGKVTAEKAVVNNGSDFIITSVGSQTSATINISSNASTVAAAAYANGDSYTFEVADEEFTLVIGADGFSNTKDGVTTQMMDLIKSRDLDGITVAANKATSAGVTITNVLTGVTAGSSNSTVLTNVVVMDGVKDVAGTNQTKIDISSNTGAIDALKRLDAALSTLSSQRAELGATSNRLDSTISNLTNISSNLTAGRGRIEDADFAAETTNLAKTQILQQASTAMLAQANASKQGVLSLLQG